MVFRTARLGLILLSLLSLVVIMGLERPLPRTAAASSLAANEKIDPALRKQFTTESQADFFIVLSEQADLSPAALLPTKEAKGQFVFDTLRATAARTQASLRAYLDREGVTYEAYYISNKILVRNGGETLLQAVAARDDVARLLPNRIHQLPPPLISDKQPESVTAVEPNISFVNADDVWGLGITGTGTVMAGNDTGLAWNHPALKNQYRGWDGVTADHNYNWWDATGTYPTAPGDGHGHGTHISGTMVGDDGGGNQIGMAPGARLIHCKNLTDFGSGSDADILECFQWDLAPWDLSGNNPRPDLAPDAINNSWGYGGGGYGVFAAEIAALQAAGIVVEASAGNAGPGCTTLGSPGDYGEILTTGSVSHASGVLPGDLTWFSSRGPSVLSPDYLPDVMAPGENVRSSLPGGAYEYWSGTSMSGPHVTGLIGLLWSANPGLRGLVAETQQIIQMTAVPLTGQTGSSCGGDYIDGPNHDWGFGTIDALAAVQAAMSFGNPGTLTGLVSDASSSAPLPGVTVRAALSSDLVWQRLSDSAGIYNMLVFSGTYTVTASLYGYYPATIPGVTVVEYTTTTLDIPLNPAPFYAVSGAVTDATTGWPLYARIDITGYPGGPVWTDPATGQYSISLAAGVDYTFNVAAQVPGYETAVRAVSPSAPQTEDFALAADSFSCSAPGYQPQFTYFENFEASDGGFTVDGFTSWAWGTPTSGPGAAHSGSNVWATNLSGRYSDYEYGTITSPDIDLSSLAGQSILVTWWQYLKTEEYYDFASVEISNDGGLNWTPIFGPISGPFSTVWTKLGVMVGDVYAVSNFRIRFILATDFSITDDGFYVDDIGIGGVTVPPPLYYADFEASDGGLVAAGANNSWQWGVPTRGPGSAHSGSNVWGTNLDGNYNNNENSTLTSPPIDLTAAAGQPILLEWWQWLHSEQFYDVATVDISADGGATWNNLLSFSGIVSDGWAPYDFILDPSYAVTDFRVRFGLQSDHVVTYPGFYVDDLLLAIYSELLPGVPCDPPNGGLVTGHVYDANTGAALNGASVSDTLGHTAVTMATTSDPNVDDGLYILFSAAGPQTLTATLAGYGPDSQTPTVILNNVVTQDFQLPTGLLEAAPSSLGATLDLGDSTTITLDLNNIGGLATDFSIRERDGGFTPARAADGRFAGTGRWLYRAETGVALRVNRGGDGDGTAIAYPSAYHWQAERPSANISVLVYADDVIHVAPNTFPQQALQLLGLSYTSHHDGDFGGFTANLNSQTWDLVIFANDNYFPDDGTLNAMSNFVAGGGRLIAHSWVVGFNPTQALWNSLGVIWAGDDYEPPDPVYWWQPDHPAFTRPDDVPEFTVLDGYIYGIYGQFVEPQPDFDALAGYTSPGPNPNQAAMLLGNAGRTVFRGFMDATNNADLDGDGVQDGVELWRNLIDGIQTDFSVDVPWLATDIVTGTIGAGGSQPVLVTFDAGVPEVAQPGTYHAELRIGNDTPYGALVVPVTMNVNAPPDWGRLSGTITGLARCDEPGAPLNNATVAIAGGPSLTTGTDGGFVYWLSEGSYAVDISAAGYVSQAFTVAVQAGQVTQLDVDLRLAAPCSSASPDAISFTVSVNQAGQRPLHLDNAGAGELNYTIYETGYQLPAAPALRRPAEAAGWYTLGMALGPTSVRYQPPDGTKSRPDAPESGWFGGSDMPGGVVRYAHAQCDEAPDSFYVISGVNSSFSISRSTWRYDAAANSWTALAPIPTGQEAPTAVCHFGRIYVMGGGGSNQFYVYDIATDSWLAAAPLPRNVEGAAAAAWAGKVYLIGGDDDFWPPSGVSDQVNVYDIASDSWTGTGAPMPFGASNAGFVQLGPVLYVVGGWGINAPGANLAVTQRFDLLSGSWQTGPAFTSARADLALAATNQALYAIGGDADGIWFFDGTSVVERLDWITWPAGSWSDLGDPLSISLAANNAGFCTEALFDTGKAEIYSVGGLDSSVFFITGRNLFREMAGERCFSIFEDLPWLTVTPAAGSVAGDGGAVAAVRVDATGLAPGVYQATLVISSNDPGAPQSRIPVTMTVNPIQPINLPVILRP